MAKLLFIEDQPEAIKPVMDRLIEQGYKCEVVGFNNAENTVMDFGPDIVILDLFEGLLAREKITGNKTLNFIWENRFCPVIIYSAEPDAIAEGYESHPYVSKIKKGKDIKKLEDEIHQLRPQAEALREAEKGIQKAFATALRDVAPYAFLTYVEPEERLDAIRRSSRRRLAAMMDDSAWHGQELASWEHYLCPPVMKNLQLGDILRRPPDGDPDDPNCYIIILSPSCDMVVSDTRKPKIDSVLVARCRTWDDKVMKSIKLLDAKKSDRKNKLPNRILTDGYCLGFIPFPKFLGKLPHMVADLRDLELIPFSDINDRKKYDRVASIDSPFSELVSWAYMQVACRPGLPDRDTKRWSRDIIDSMRWED